MYGHIRTLHLVLFLERERLTCGEFTELGARHPFMVLLAARGTRQNTIQRKLQYLFNCTDCNMLLPGCHCECDLLVPARTSKVVSTYR